MYESFVQAVDSNKAAITQTVPMLEMEDKEHILEFSGGTVFFEMTDRKKAIKYYRECPPLSYILNKKVSFTSNGVYSCVRMDKEGKNIPSTDRELLKVLKYPNPLRTFTQFHAEVEIMTDLYGYCPILKVVPAGFDTPTELWVLPPNMLDIRINDKYFVGDMREMIDSITFTHKGRQTNINKEDVYLYTGRTSTVDDLLFPCSRLHSMKYPITNLIYNYESRGTIFKRRGPVGILTPENDASGPVRAKPEDKEELQKQFRSYGLMNNQYTNIISTIAMRWQSMGMNVSEMQLLEMGNDDIMTLCDAFDLKYPLIARGTGTTFNNQNEAKKSQYQDTAIPDANNFVEQLTDIMGAEAKGCKYIADFSHVESMKADKLAESRVRKTNVSAVSEQFQKNLITYGAAMALLEQEPPAKLAGKYFYEMPPEFQATYSGLKQTQTTTEQP